MARICILLALHLSLFLAMASCRSRPVGGSQDGGIPTDAAVPVDGAQPPSDGAVTCAETQAWAWTHPSIDAIYADPLTSVEGETVRLFVSVLFDGCDDFIAVSASVDPATRQIQVWPYLLQRPLEQGCIGELAFGQDILVYGALSPGTWTVSALYGGSPSTTFDIGACGPGDDCYCTQSTPNLPYGSSCTYQCECERPNVCVRYLSLGGIEHRQCLPSCSDDAQCAPGYACQSRDDGPSAVCQPMFTGPTPILCQGDGECAVNEFCHTWPDGARSCAPTEESLFAFDRERCDCTDQCGGLTCIALEGEDMFWNECRKPCRGDRDCPPGLWSCAARSEYSEPVCFWIGE